MAIAVGVSGKNSNAGASSLATSSVTTQVSGSTFVAIMVWGADRTFSSVADSKSNTYTQIGTEISTGATSAQYKARMYYKENGTGGASHTFTVTVSGVTSISVAMLEITGGATSTILDQSANVRDTASPFTLTAGLTTTQAIELLVSGLTGTSGSNPATHAESGLGSSTINIEETNGASFWTFALANVRKTSTGTFNPSWTESGNTTDGAVWLGTFKEAGGGGGVTVKQLAALGCG